jgi:hypothetical protein
MPKPRKTKNSQGVVPNFPSSQCPKTAPIPTDKAIERPTVLRYPKVLKSFFVSLSMVDSQGLSPEAGDLAGWRFDVPHAFLKSQ